MNRSNNLKWRRKEAGLSRREFANIAGVSMGTVGRLESDETTWDTMQDGTTDKILNALESLSKRDDKVVEPVVEETDEVEELVSDCDQAKVSKWVMEMKQYEEDQLTKADTKTMILVEFAYEGLTEAKTHSEFIANVKLLKRILKDY